MRIIFIHCITTIINLVNHVILIVYIIVNFRPLIWLNKQHPKSTDIQSNTAGTFHCSLSLGTIFIDWAKNKQTNYLPILCLKCQLLDINFLFIALLYNSNITLAVVQLYWKSSQLLLAPAKSQPCRCDILYKCTLARPISLKHSNHATP